MPSGRGSPLRQLTNVQFKPDNTGWSAPEITLAHLSAMVIFQPEERDTEAITLWLQSCRAPKQPRQIQFKRVLL